LEINQGYTLEYYYDAQTHERLKKNNNRTSNKSQKYKCISCVWWQQVSLQRWYISTQIHSVTFQTSVIFQYQGYYIISSTV